MQPKGTIAVMIEGHYDPTEAPAFEMFFPACGYQVEYVSDLRGSERRVFFDNDHAGSVTVDKDVRTTNPADYVGLILVGGYAMDMLRYEVHVDEGEPNIPPATRFLEQAMSVPNLVVGTICHSLWLATPLPELIRGRHVTCGHNIMFDVRNAGAHLVFDSKRRMLADTHVDGNLVTSRHPYVIQGFMDAYLAELEARR